VPDDGLTPKHVQSIDEFNRSLLCMTAIYILILTCHSTMGRTLLNFKKTTQKPCGVAGK
jgi:hypothetical protein